MSTPVIEAPSARPVTHLRFAAMGTRAHLIQVGGTPGLVEAGQQRVDQLESRWSRFRSNSEISLLNRAAGRPVNVSQDTAELVRLGCLGWEMSAGAFDPTVLPSLVAHGYDRSFDLLDAPADPPTDEMPSPGCGNIEIDSTSATVRLPAGVEFDPGGLGKGLAADIIVAELLAGGAAGALVNLGGDLVAAGDPPDDDGGWTVDIVEPTIVSGTVATISFEAGAVATSATTRRRWLTGQAECHHLIDPTTGRPIADAPLLVTTVASSGWLAEVAAKAYMTGRELGPAIAGIPALTVHADGRVTAHAGFEEYVQ